MQQILYFHKWNWLKVNGKNAFTRSILFKIVPVLTNILCKTLRIEIINKEFIEKLYSQNQNFVLAFWHGKMIVPWFLHREKNFSALVSTSKDGDILTSVLKNWKFNVVRGSSHKGGKESLQLMIDLAGQNSSIAITPDGPTGPKEIMKAGAVVLAKKTEIPLVLAGVYIKRKISLNSWDDFQIPKPFSKVIVKYSEPIRINNLLSYDETSTKIKNLGCKLSSLNDEAKNLC